MYYGTPMLLNLFLLYLFLGTWVFHNTKVNRVIYLTGTLFCQKGVYFGPGYREGEVVLSLF